MSFSGILLRRAVPLIAILAGCGSPPVGATYSVLAVSAQVGTRDDQGNCRVPGCTPPTTYVCVTLGALRQCTAPRTAAAPEWLEGLFASVAADTLKAGFSVELVQGAGSAADPVICRSNVVADDAILAAGQFDVPCVGGVRVTLALRPN